MMDQFDDEFAAIEQVFNAGLFIDSAKLIKQLTPQTSSDLQKFAFLSARLVESLIDADSRDEAYQVADSTFQRFRPISAESVSSEATMESIQSFLLAAALTGASAEYEEVIEECLRKVVDVTKGNWIFVWRFIGLLKSDQLLGPEIGRNAFHINQWVSLARREWAEVPFAQEILTLDQLLQSSKQSDSLERMKELLSQIAKGVIGG